MKPTNLTIIILCAMTSILIACCSSNPADKHRDPAIGTQEPLRTQKGSQTTTFIFPPYSYNALEVRSIFNVVMTDTADSIRIEISDELARYLSVRLHDGRLIIGLEPLGRNHTLNNPIATVSLPYNMKMNEIELCGVASFSTKLPLRSNEFEIDMSGASNLTAKYIQAASTDLSLSGTANFNCDLRTTEADLSLSGASYYHGNITCRELDASLSGTAAMDGTLTCKELDATLSGASNMTMQGSADDAELTLSGTASLSGLSVATASGIMSGVSKANIKCSNRIALTLSGTSQLTYTGNARNECTVGRAASVIINN